MWISELVYGVWSKELGAQSVRGVRVQGDKGVLRRILVRARGRQVRLARVRSLIRRGLSRR